MVSLGTQPPKTSNGTISLSETSGINAQLYLLLQSTNIDINYDVFRSVLDTFHLFVLSLAFCAVSRRYWKSIILILLHSVAYFYFVFFIPTAFYWISFAKESLQKQFLYFSAKFLTIHELLSELGSKQRRKRWKMLLNDIKTCRTMDYEIITKWSQNCPFLAAKKSFFVTA